MSKQVERVLKHLGFKDDYISNLLSEEPPEDFNAVEIADARLNEIVQIHNQKNPPQIDEQLKAARIAGAKDVKQSLGKAFGIAKTRSEFEQMDNREFVELLSKTHDEAVKKGTSDEKLAAELNEFRTKYLETKDELDDFKKVAENRINEAAKQADVKVRQFLIDKKYEEEFSKVDWGVPKEMIPVVKEGIVGKLKQMPWTTDENGNLSGPDGNGLAIDFEGKGHFKHISEAINVLVQPVTKKSYGTGSGNDVTKTDFNGATDEAKVAVERMKERMGIK